jgi:peptidyl-prolyl cis-trans isomerase SurA
MASLAAVFLAQVPLSSVIGAETVDRIMVVVNDDVIMESEFRAELQRISGEMRLRNATIPPRPLLERQVLDKMVNDRLRAQAAERLGIRVSDSELDSAVRSIAARNDISVDQLRAELRAGGVSFDSYRNEIRKQVLVQKLVDRQIARSVDVSNTEVDEYVQRLREEEGADVSFELSHILISSAGESSGQADAKRAKAEEALEAIENGMSFEQAAARYSEAPDALEGGRLAPRTVAQLPSLFVESIRNLEAGQHTDVIESPNGFHILKVNGRRSGLERVVDQYRVRHILMRTNDVRDAAETRRQLEQVRQRIINGEDFADLARLHSEDIQSRVKGGDLGWMNPGDIVPRFERAVDRLELGEVSEVIETRYGFHIIKLLERRKRDIGEEYLEVKARRELTSQRIDERLEQWQADLRAQAYIDQRVRFQ